eukprot:TRINITY_DN19505_c0_g1_i1.p1 TRINITY_DN19505_c0_g1~~TRINITY_DN19505_c0_g1_i1.p1  ORF type:complete len:873 (-),score=121.17 TRINITY_DN19505_c0_g1_i1:22-2382(-)
MKSKGWAGVDVSTIKVKDTSGFGGSQTYKVSAEGVEPAAVALHSRSEAVTTDELSDPRMEAAASTLSAHGLVPPRLAYGGDWFIEVWEGSGKPAHQTIEKAREIGEYLARLHAVPVEWYDVWRERLIDRFAKQCPEAQAAGQGLDTVPRGSHIWWFTCRECWLKEMDAAKRAQWFKEDFFAPVTTAGRRIVTTHGDFHVANMIQTEGGIKGIDLEFTHVTHAAIDLGYTLTTCEFEKRDLRRAFLEAYLVASGLPSEESDIDALFLDASFSKLGFHFGPMAPWRFSENGPLIVRAYKRAIEVIRSHPAPFLDWEKCFFKYAESLPEFKAEYAAAEVVLNDELWSRLDALPAAEAQNEPITKLACHAADALTCETSQFSCACWLYLHSYQRYTHQLSIVATGDGVLPGDMCVGLRERSFFKLWINGNTEVVADAAKDVDLFDSQWHHIVFAYNATDKSQTLYVDGGPRRTVTYLAARPVRLPGTVIAGGYPSSHVPMEPYKARASGDKLLLIRVSEHKDDSYNGVYVQQWDEAGNNLRCGMPFFKNKHGRYLKKYDARAGGGPDWSFDHRIPDDMKDLCDGGAIDAKPGVALPLGKRKWSNGVITISWAAWDPEKLDDVDCEGVAQPVWSSAWNQNFDDSLYFPEGQLMETALFCRCIGGEEVAQMYSKEVLEERKETCPPLVASCAVEKVPLDATLTWKEHWNKAVELGGVLPTKMDLILNEIAAGAVDAWIPVLRDDGKEGDWVQIGDMNPHPIYHSHLDKFGLPQWGSNNDPSPWRPQYFFVAR